MIVMAGNFGGVGQQVVDNIFELGQSAVKGVAKASVDIVKDTIETVTTAPSSVAAQQSGDRRAETGQSSATSQQAAQKKQEEKRQYDLVKNEIATFVQRKKQQDEQIAREREQESQEKKQKESFEKRKKDSFVQQLMNKIGGASHGETSKQKE